MINAPVTFLCLVNFGSVKIVWQPHKSINNFRTKQKIKTRRHGFFDQPFGMGQSVVPPAFHKVRVYAISFRRLSNFKVLISREYLVPHFRLTFCRILFLSFHKTYTFMGFPLNSWALRLRKASCDLPPVIYTLTSQKAWFRKKGGLTPITITCLCEHPLTLHNLICACYNTVCD